MEEPSHSEVQKRTADKDPASFVPTLREPRYRNTLIVVLGIGVVVAGVVLAFGRALATVLFGYMPVPVTIAVIAIPLLLFVLVDRGVLLKPNPLSPAERDRFLSLKGETLEEIKELIDFNLRTGNRKQANEWAAKALKLSGNSEVKKIR